MLRPPVLYGVLALQLGHQPLLYCNSGRRCSPIASFYRPFSSDPKHKDCFYINVEYKRSLLLGPGWYEYELSTMMSKTGRVVYATSTRQRLTLKKIAPPFFLEFEWEHVWSWKIVFKKVGVKKGWFEFLHETKKYQGNHSVILLH